MVGVLKMQFFDPHGVITRLVLFHTWNQTVTTCWEAWDLKLARLDGHFKKMSWVEIWPLPQRKMLKF